MKASELRIGNWVGYTFEHHSNPTHLQVIGIECFDGCLNVRLDSGISTNLPEPIQLTEEWLVRCGFEGTEQDMWVVLPNGDGSELHIEKELMSNDMNILFTRGDSSKVPGKDFDYVYAGVIRFVHQLQNLYFALTGKELTLNPEPAKT